MNESNNNPVTEIKQAELKAKQIIAAARESARKKIIGLTGRMEIERKRKSAEAQAKAEEDVLNLEKEINKQLKAAETEADKEASNIKSQAKNKFEQAVDHVVKKLISD